MARSPAAVGDRPKAQATAAGELAAAYSKGPGSFKVNFYDEVYNLNEETIERMSRIEKK